MSEVQTGILLGELIEKLNKRIDCYNKIRTMKRNGMWQLTCIPEKYDAPLIFCELESPAHIIEFIIENKDDIIKSIRSHKVRLRGNTYRRYENLDNILFWKYYRISD